MVEQSPSKTEKIKLSARHQLEKLNLKPRGVVGNFIQRALSGMSTTMKQTGGRQLDYPEVKATTQVLNKSFSGLSLI